MHKLKVYCSNSDNQGGRVQECILLPFAPPPSPLGGRRSPPGENIGTLWKNLKLDRLIHQSCSKGYLIHHPHFAYSAPPPHTHTPWVYLYPVQNMENRLTAAPLVTRTIKNLVKKKGKDTPQNSACSMLFCLQVTGDLTDIPHAKSECPGYAQSGGSQMTCG